MSNNLSKAIHYFKKRRKQNSDKKVLNKLTKSLIKLSNKKIKVYESMKHTHVSNLLERLNKKERILRYIIYLLKKRGKENSDKKTLNKLTKALIKISNKKVKVKIHELQKYTRVSKLLKELNKKERIIRYKIYLFKKRLINRKVRAKLKLEYNAETNYYNISTSDKLFSIHYTPSSIINEDVICDELIDCLHYFLKEKGDEIMEEQVLYDDFSISLMILLSFETEEGWRAHEKEIVSKELKNLVINYEELRKEIKIKVVELLERYNLVIIDKAVIKIL